MRNKYYSTRRPILPGGYPKTAKVLEIHNFDTPKLCEEIKQEVWGYILYEEPISDKDAADYELVSAAKKPYWCVVSTFDDHGNVTANITNVEMAVKRPTDTFRSTSRKDIYVNYFPSKEEAEAYVQEARCS